jgi:hypothetical protein
MRDETAALVWWHLIFLDRSSNGGLLIGRVVDDATSFAGVPLIW